MDAYLAAQASIDRVNQILEKDLAIRLEVVSDETLFFPDPMTDPYGNFFSPELQATVATQFSPSEYDLAHLFVKGSTINGNGGCIGCVCVDGQKDRGWSQHTFAASNGLPFQSDHFDVDILAHEIGHQLGAVHSFSMMQEGTGFNMEPGSGSTIMGRPGRTNDDVVLRAQDNFHPSSINRILDNIVPARGGTRTCWQSNPASITITNQAPSADAGFNYAIPAGTAYQLQGNATDPENQTMAYAWDPYTNGLVTSNLFGPTHTSGATIRSLPPSSDLDRYVPNLARINAGMLTQTNPQVNDDWETVSNVARVQEYAFIVRDTPIVASGPSQCAIDLMQLTIVDTGAPFAVTAPGSGNSYVSGGSIPISWDVAGTTGNGINVSQVQIVLSTDGGLTYDQVLTEATNNDGNESLTLPITTPATTDARIMVRAVGNIFLAVNPGNFEITDPTLSVHPNPTTGAFQVQSTIETLEDVVVIHSLSGVTLSRKRANQQPHTYNLASGVYLVSLERDGQIIATQKLIVQ